MRQQLEAEALRGEDAKQFLNNKTFKDAFEGIERDLLDQMKIVKPSDEKAHLRLIDAYKLLHRLKAHIEQVVNTGKIAQFQLNEPNKVKSFFRR